MQTMKNVIEASDESDVPWALDESDESDVWRASDVRIHRMNQVCLMNRVRREMEDNMFKNIMQKLTAKVDLTSEEVYGLIVAIKNDELSDVQIAGFQVALLMKGPTLLEITAIAQAMRDNCIRISPRVNDELMDTCGTGGGLSTFNISTSVAFVAAAAGIPVAKHGSRSISSLSGSADVLESLGVEINQTPQSVEKLIEEIGIAFLYAPLFHPVMGKVLPPEKDLGIKTIFYTIIGPLINPSKATRHVLGVYKSELLDVVAQVAASLGYKRALFVHGEDGLDEISLLGKTRINELNNGHINSYEITPEDFGLSRCTLSEIATGTPKENATMIGDVFSGRDKGSRRQAVILNAAGALMIGEKAASFREGIELAGEIIDSGAAQRKLNELIEASHDHRESSHDHREASHDHRESSHDHREASHDHRESSHDYRGASQITE